MDNGTIELAEGSGLKRLDQPSQPNASEISADLRVSRPDSRMAPIPSQAPANRIAPGSLEARRAETANFIGQISGRQPGAKVSATAVDNMLSMFVSLAQMSVRPPLFFVNYLKDKVFT